MHWIVLALLAAFLLGTLGGAAEEPLFVARPFTPENSFTEGIEGPACDGHHVGAGPFGAPGVSTVLFGSFGL